tara:strand:- start:271 stop:1038 length:768 start_codon:yes stop_codon:yes gene_type:complete
MGALHQGHLSLVQRARQESTLVVATIFVNPTQFGPGEDFEQYPRTLQDDLQQCEQAGADLVFTPKTDEMYGADAQTFVRVTELTQRLEGAHRPTHFEGVTTIVAKLFNITVPTIACFGQKDYQQQLIIRQMVKDLNFGVKIVTCPIIREADGLALSSRNRYLSETERNRALVLNRALRNAGQQAEGGVSPAQIAVEMQRRIHDEEGVELEYAVVADERTLQPVCEDTDSAVALVAARVGKTRLIDNAILRFPSTP